MAQEIALVRRRTVNQGSKISQRAPVALGRSASTAGRRGMQPPVLEQIRDESPSSSIQQSPVERQDSNASGQVFNNDSSDSLHGSGANRSVGDTAEGPIEEPYDHNAPRSIISLQRAASAANTRRIQQFEERRAETLFARENGDFPLPQYTEEANTPLPGRYRAMAGLEQPKMLPKVSSSPQMMNGNRSQAGDSATIRPPLDALVAAPATIPEDSVGHFQTPFAQPTNPDAFVNGNMPGYPSRTYSNAAQSNFLPASSQNGSPHQNGRQQWQTASPSLGQPGVHQVSPMTSLGSMRTPQTAYQPSTVAQSAMPQHIADENHANGLGITAEESPLSSSYRRSEAEREEIRRRLEQSKVQPQQPQQSFSPAQPIAIPMQQTFDSLLLPATSVSPDISRSQSLQPVRSRHLPPHVTAMQDAFHSSTPDAVSSSLFPMNPHRRHSVQPTAGTIAHPVLNWVPPAASQATPYQSSTPYQPPIPYQSSTTYQPSQPIIPPQVLGQSPAIPQLSPQPKAQAQAPQPPPPIPPIPQDPYLTSRASHSNTSLSSLHRPASAPGLNDYRSRDRSRSRPPSRAPSRAGTSAGRERSRSRVRAVFGGRRTPKYVFDGREWVEEEGRRCVVM